MRQRFGVAGIATTALLLAIMTSLTDSIQQQRWTQGLEVLWPIAVLGVLAGVVLAVSRLGALRAHALGWLLGIGVVVWQTGHLLPPEQLEASNRFALVWERFVTWVGVVLDGGSSYDPTLFVLTMGAIVWFLAYNSAWFVLRYGWVWWAVLPAGVVLLVNLGYAVRPNTRTFVLFVLASMLLMIHIHYLQRQERWDRAGLGYERGLVPKVLLFGGALSLVLLFAAWQGPSRGLASTARGVLQQLQEPWGQVQDRWERAFAFLYPNSPGARSGIGGGFTSFSDSYELGGPLRLGNQTVFTAQEAEAQQYWRAAADDTYTGRGWRRGDGAGPARDPVTARAQVLRSQVARDEATLPEGMRKLEQEVTIMLPTREGTLFAADTPINVAGRSAVWTLPLVERRANVGLRDIVASPPPRYPLKHLGVLRGLIEAAGVDSVTIRLGSRVSVEPQLPPGLLDEDGERAPPPEATANAQLRDDAQRAAAAAEEEIRGQLRALARVGVSEVLYRPPAEGRQPTLRYAYATTNERDVYQLQATAPIPRNGKYEVTSIVAHPTDPQLNASKGAVTAWVTERYLQLPDALPARVSELARRVVQAARARTTHQKAQAIEQYLRRSFRYETNVPPLPAGRDFVDFFLNDVRTGYCTSYASAMAVMLRAVDVPARTVRGFAPGEFEQEIDAYRITMAQAHMWPQVYYPEYGWIDYEPTPIRDPVSRAAAIGGGDGRDSAFNRTDRSVQTGEDSGGGGGAQGAGANELAIPAAVRYLATTLAALAGLGALAYAFYLVRLRGLRGARRQYAKLVELGTVLGLRPAVSATPGEYASRLGEALPRAREPVGEITSRYVAEVFGRRQDGGDLRSQWRRVISQGVRAFPARFGAVFRRFRPRR